MTHRFGRASLVLHRGRLGIVVSKHGHICPWYRVEFHQPMPMPHSPPMDPGWLDRGCHKKRPEWHYQVSLEPLPSDWDGTVPASLLRRIRGLQGFCFGRSKGWEDGRRREHFKERALDR
ncbi:hypothetical protein LCGC14_2910170 [marine sediment metagenome]|uniref:Uncharacterized protein n=1 Tax=marine sediment metagenome TaxID=412755 RepID=A0A0F9AHZ4_9ZZZZ